jgi:hypothetical protein
LVDIYSDMVEEGRVRWEKWLMQKVSEKVWV